MYTMYTILRNSAHEKWEKGDHSGLTNLEKYICSTHTHIHTRVVPHPPRENV